MGRMEDEAVFDLEKVKEYLNKYNIIYKVIDSDTVEILEDVYFVEQDIAYELPACLFLASSTGSRYIEEIGCHVLSYTVKFIVNINSGKGPKVRDLFDTRGYEECNAFSSRYEDERSDAPFIGTIYERGETHG